MKMKGMAYDLLGKKYLKYEVTDAVVNALLDAERLGMETVQVFTSTGRMTEQGLADKCYRDAV